ncbi:hypothetical protein [Acinetobacter baumannii]|uniref:hypothetical protein n=1 Tax=Acinetobacter baumannii TaxID=470 RepID=UPI001BC89831|nr:hypothetical protein [Acinetobacter baumannii]
MTVSISERLSPLYEGNGTNTRFDFTFRVFDQEDASGVSVKHQVDADFENIDESLYTVVINEDNLGGYITFYSPPNNGFEFYIAGETPVDQQLDITNYDNFYPDAIERSLDKLTAILQEWAHSLALEKISREKALELLNIAIQEQIREQGVALDQLEDYYNYLMQRLAQIAVDKGWDASFVVDGDKNQKQINAEQQVVNDGIKSRDELRLLNPPRKGLRVYLVSIHEGLGLGGGWFISTQKSGLVDNGGTIIASSNPLFFWVRVDCSYLTPEMFGADGINDDYPAIKTMYATLPRTGGEVRLSRFHKVSKGVLIPPRSKTVGVGRDSCGFLKTTHDFESLPDRIWQDMTRSYNMDYLVAIDIDSDIWGNIDGDQIRSTTLRDFSAKCIAPVGVASYGLYTFEVYHFNMESLTFENVDVGVEYEGWLSRMLSVSVRNCRVGLRAPNGGTSLHCDNFYVKRVSERAYDLNNLTYSTFTTCCADFCEDIAYRVHGCFGIVFNGCGFEEVKNHDLYITDSNIVINSMRGMNNPWGANTVSTKYINNSKVIFNGCHYNYYGVTGNNGRKPWEITNNSIISLVNTTHPAKENMPTDPDKYDFGSGRNIVNITNEDGVSTIVGGSGSQYKGVMNNGIFTVISDYDAPTFAVPLLLDGTRWNRKVPNSGGYYGWVFNAATGQWLSISKVVV